MNRTARSGRAVVVAAVITALGTVVAAVLTITMAGSGGSGNELHAGGGDSKVSGTGDSSGSTDEPDLVRVPKISGSYLFECLQSEASFRRLEQEAKTKGFRFRVTGGQRVSGDGSALSPLGQVSDQYPKPGDMVERGTTVELFVNYFIHTMRLPYGEQATLALIERMIRDDELTFDLPQPKWGGAAWTLDQGKQWPKCPYHNRH